MTAKEEEFYKQYNEAHRYCPKCGERNHTTTLVAYILDINNTDKYKDRNRCECNNCGNIHIMHDRISKEEALKL